MSLNITKNLEAALRHFRGPTRPKPIWVDAICINQSDDEEKGWQVALMGDVYHLATRTWIWLGEISADSDVAMDFITSYRKASNNQSTKVLDRNILEVPWQAILHLMGRAWWRRIWVVQEALRSRHSIVQCGNKNTDLVHLVKFMAFHGNSDPELPDKKAEEARTLSQQPFVGILARWYHHKQVMDDGSFSLRSSLFLTFGLQASIRRDKIFALLGLVTPNVHSWITPDYSDEVTDRQILTRLTVYLLQTSLQPLRVVGYSRATNCP